jgi:hypothetical protein
MHPPKWDVCQIYSVCLSGFVGGGGDVVVSVVDVGGGDVVVRMSSESDIF